MKTIIYVKEDEEGNEEIQHIYNHPEFENDKDSSILMKMGLIRLMRIEREKNSI